MPKNKYSKIIAGVMNWGIWGADLSTNELTKLIQGCVENGVTSFDHADIYGDHTTEAAWGVAWKLANLDRDKIQIITKCGIMHPSAARSHIKAKHYDTSHGHIIHSVENSLKNLKTDYIDMLLIHRPSPLLNPDEVAKAVDTLKSSGKILQFGVSNFTPSQLTLLQSSVEVESNQVEISPFALEPFLDGTLDQCMLQNIVPMAWSPLGGGKLFKTASNPKTLNQRERLQEVAKKYGWELDEMAYLFLLHHPADIKIVTGSSKLDRIKTATDAVHTIISDAQWFEIWSAATGVDVP